MNILLVEDDDLDAELFERGVRKSGDTVNVTRARDGLEALNMLTETKEGAKPPHPCVILLDINMPRMNGHEFLAKLQSNTELTGHRVFVFTTSANQTDIDRAYGNNASGYIVKPDSTSEFRQVLDMLRYYWDVCKHPARTLAVVSGMAEAV